MTNTLDFTQKIYAIEFRKEDGGQHYFHVLVDFSIFSANIVDFARIFRVELLNMKEFDIPDAFEPSYQEFMDAFTALLTERIDTDSPTWEEFITVLEDALVWASEEAL